MDTQQLANVEKHDISPAEMIMAAVSSQADLEKVEKLLELQERWDANQARKIFAKAFAKAQANILPVIKKRFNSQTKSKYSELADVIEASQPIYTAEGFSVIFNEGESPLAEHIRIIADVLHSAGHKETYHLDIPLDGKGLQGNANMTKIHGKASSIAYGRRYLLCMIWNIPTQDNDGVLPTANITPKQVAEIKDLLKNKDLTEDALCLFLGVTELDKIPSTQYMKALSAINSAKKKA